MSQWNNSYAYNNQYQGHSTWNGDMSAQYINQAYFSDPNRQYNPSNQYVSFNEFLAQMQSAGVPTAIPTNVPSANSMSYNNIQYQNYPNNQYNYQNVPSQNAQIDYSFGSNTNNSAAPSSVEQAYQVTPHPQQHQYETDVAGTSKYNEMVFNSKLTPTATEFVPKNCGVDTSSSSSSISQPSKPSTSKNSVETVNVCNSSSQSKTSRSEKNWRERPQTSQSNGSSNVEENFDRQMKNFRGQYKNSSNGYNENSNQNTDVNGQKQDVYYRSQESGKHNYDSNSYNHDRNHSKNAIESNSDTSETSTRYQDRNRRNESNSYQRSNNRQSDSNNYNHEQHRNSDGNYRGDGGPSKPNSKQNNKNKETDARMFYNSSMPKGSQDVRNGRGDSSGRRGWAGSQRVRATERDNVEDEQYANTYLQYRENKLSKEPKASPVRNKNKNGTNHGNATANTEMTQRERLSEQLDKGTLECLVCCERVKQIDSVWWCSNCYHVLHLKCIRKWALSSVIEGKWRCPACQNPSSDIPTEYRCMCGAVRNPEYQRGSSGAHTCGRACQRPRTCPHPCTLLCHPGPCPPCQATVNKHCGCGTETRMVLCSSKLPQVCGRQCQKKLECDVHTCKKDCHEGPCEECVETVTQVCHCSVSKTRVVACTRGVTADWTCGAECGRILGCGAHVCRRVCHPPPCAPCPLRPESVLACPCGKMRIKKGQRKSCTDPIPLCDNICAKPLRCGPEEERHFCKEKCHEGECPVCPDSTHLQCRCGHSTREVPCKDLPTVANNVTCQRKCNKKLSCGRHRCREVCCDGNEHMCTVVCGRSLFCQQHRCEEYCHAGHCAPCPRLNFDEVRCECGESVLLPPVRCGARPPACTATCIRPRPCGHPPHHSCHTDECPPCVVLTTRVCHGGHEERKTIPCSQEEFSCGLPCGKPLPCGKHTCIKVCHKGPCDTGKCTQPCTEKRPSCGHPCAAACHSGTGSACPSASACRRTVRATCPCGRRSAERACADNARDLARIMSTLAVSKMQEGGSVDLSDVQRPVNMLKTLECDDECRQEARSRQLALALQIRNPDVSAKLAPRYSEHVRATCAREPAFAHHVHERLTELVQRAKSSKQKTRSHSFPSMNRQKRQFIHEMCEHFGCESVAYDAEPNRNVVATADREKSWLPAMSVMEVLAREAGKRRVPGPVLRAPAATTSTAAATPAATGAAPKSTGGWATLTSTNAWAARSARTAQQQQSQQSQPQQHQQQQQQQQAVAPKIDYFDNPPDN